MRTGNMPVAMQHACFQATQQASYHKVHATTAGCGSQFTSQSAHASFLHQESSTQVMYIRNPARKLCYITLHYITLHTPPNKEWEPH
jgi:hypothetical protein